MAKVKPETDSASEASGKHSSFNLDGLTRRDGDCEYNAMGNVSKYMFRCNWVLKEEK